MEPLQKENPHPQRPLQTSLNVTVIRALIQVPQTGPLWKEMPVSIAFPTYLSGSTAREPTLQVPFTELPQTDTALPETLSIVFQIPR